MNIRDITPHMIDSVLRQSIVADCDQTPRLLDVRPALELIRLLADSKEWERFYESLKRQSRMAPQLGLHEENMREAQAYLVLRLGMLIGLRAAEEVCHERIG